MTLLPEELRFRAAGTLGYGLVRALFATVRFERESVHHLTDARGRSRGVLLVCWHDQLLPLIHAHRNEGIVALVSEHADGEYIRRVLQPYGFGVVRGSSTRGGARGLRELVREARGGRDLAVTPDGPRGPRHRFKEGALVVAQLSGLPVVPLVGAASSAWRFNSWDRFLVPRPFSTVRIAYGSPLPVPRDADRAERQRLARGLEATMEELLAASAAPFEAGAETVDRRARRGREEGRAPMA